MHHLIDRLSKHSIVRHQLSRHYVAESYANTLEIPTRIRNKQDIIHLQILTSSKLGPKLRAATTIRESLFGSAWHTLLKIDNKKQGIYYEETYVDPESEQNDTLFIPPEKIVFPENIFGIPQLVWEIFIGHLEHQEVVHILNLKQHRHLWPAYQYAMSAPTAHLIIARAKLIGRFHFLLSIALYHPNDITQQQNNIKNEFQFSVLTDIKHDLDRGEFDKKNMMRLHDCFTLVVVNKLRYCSNILDLNLLVTMVSNYAKTALDPIDKNRKWGASNMLPFSDTEPTRFASALQLAKTINRISARPGLLFFNSQSQWAAYSSKEGSMNSLGKHYFDALFHDLVRRQIILQAHAANVFIDSNLLHLIKEQFESLFLQDTTFNKIEALQIYWQHNSHTIAAMKSSQNIERFWSPIISNTKINGINIRPLASEDDLIRHGTRMQHCVQTDVFVNFCRNMYADILELESEDGEISTLDIRPGYRNDYYLLQHVGVGGHKKPGKLHIEAGIKLVEELRAGRIKLSKARQTESLDKSAKPLYKFDYDLDDLATQDRIYQLYKSKKMLPHRLIFVNYLELLESTKLVTMIDDVIKKVSEDEYVNTPSSHRH